MGFVSKSNFLDRCKTFRQQNDNRYLRELKTASPTEKGGIKVGNGLEMNGETLNIKLGYGLAFDTNGILKVTLTGGGGTSSTQSGGGTYTGSVDDIFNSVNGGGGNYTLSGGGGTSSTQSGGGTYTGSVDDIFNSVNGGGGNYTLSGGGGTSSTQSGSGTYTGSVDDIFNSVNGGGG